LLESLGFEKSLRYDFDVPRGLAKVIARYLPLTEILLGVTLVVGLETRVAAAIAVLLMILFSIQLFRLHAKGRHGIACGCFGGRSRNHPVLLLMARNIFIGVASFGIAISGSNSFSLVPRHSATLETVPIAAMSAGLLLSLSVLFRVRITYQNSKRVVGD